eukprot:11664139-Alexandrium_andersonii.AAC.1
MPVPAERVPRPTLQPSPHPSHTLLGRGFKTCRKQATRTKQQRPSSPAGQGKAPGRGRAKGAVKVWEPGWVGYSPRRPPQG